MKSLVQQKSPSLLKHSSCSWDVARCSQLCLMPDSSTTSQPQEVPEPSQLPKGTLTTQSYPRPVSSSSPDKSPPPSHPSSLALVMVSGTSSWRESMSTRNPLYCRVFLLNTLICYMVDIQKQQLPPPPLFDLENLQGSQPGTGEYPHTIFSLELQRRWRPLPVDRRGTWAHSASISFALIQNLGLFPCQ